jgi:3-keto-5-aminohexanoate cleavage enzyme
MVAEDKKFREQPILWDAHLEPKWAQQKKLIISVATGWLTKEQNPTQPYTPEETASEVVDAYKAGASIWHIHVRRPQGGSLVLEPREMVEIHKQMCDLVFPKCPDIITDPSAGQPTTDDNIDIRITSYFGQLVRENPHYAEIAVLNMGTMNLGRWPKQFLFLNRLPVLLEHVKALQSLGVKPEFACYNLGMIEDVKEHFFSEASKPAYISTCQGIHNTEPPRFELTKVAKELLPKEDIVWQMIPGGRNWLPLAVWAIMLGCDVIRVGKEDTLFVYPDQDVKISRCSEVVSKVATIARELGREIATPKEARERLGLRQIS